MMRVFKYAEILAISVGFMALLPTPETLAQGSSYCDGYANLAYQKPQA